MNPKQVCTVSTAVAFALCVTGCGSGGGGNAPSTMFNVAAAGDIAQCNDQPPAASAAARTAALLNAQDVVVLTLGDNAYENGTPSEFAECYHPTWGVARDRTHPSPGNHDYNTAGAEGYFSYFGAAAGPDRRGYYSFDYGGWHFISLNSLIDVSTGSAQYQWLVADLANSNARCTIAYWHFPLFSSGATYGPSPIMKPLVDALYRAGAEVILSGHEHLYERFAPQTPDGVADPARGVRQFVAGTGGHELNKFGPPTPNSEVRIEGKFGILRLTLGDGQYSWAFVPVGGGEPLDSGSDNCHR